MSVQRAQPAAARQPLMRLTILDRYCSTELRGRSLFGAAAFTLIFVATQFLAIGRLVPQRARAAAGRRSSSSCGSCRRICWSSRWRCCSARCSRCSGSRARARSRRSRPAASRSARMFLPLLAVGLVVSLVAFVVQEALVPLANDQAAELENSDRARRRVQSRSHRVGALPGGGKQSRSPAAEPQRRRCSTSR